MPLTVATWNINSYRLREPLVLRFLEEVAPDLLCLQETKCPAEKLPQKAAELGYAHTTAKGFKGYNGVAILSRHPLEDVQARELTAQDDARHISAVVRGVRVHNFYVPAGGDVPDPTTNPKFDHKLRVLAEMAQGFDAARPEASLLVGDLNVAPDPEDVWSHKQLLSVVSHTPVEVEALSAAREAGGWCDLARRTETGKLYSWWSYRAKDWAASDRGRRLDHIWTSSDLTPAAGEVTFHRHARGWDKPSDHIPVTVTLDI